MIALNVDRDFVSRVRREGWAAIPADERVGLSDPAAASTAYRESLVEVYAVEQSHATGGPESGDPHQAAADAGSPADEVAAPAIEAKASADADDAPAIEGDALAEEAEEPAVDIESALESEDFARFVAAQLTWDRAMAEALAAARQRQPDSLVVGILGRGHVEHGYGVPHQLADLGISGAAVVLPIERAASCDGLRADLADAVFVIESPARVAPPPPRPRLGVMLERSDDGVQIVNVMEGSIAEAIALQPDDIVVSAAGFPIAQLSELIEIVQRQAPGTWLPLTIRRDGENLDFVAKFPTEFDSAE
jgi:hypothetical protein